MPDKYRVLVLCTGNACRSQMAEGLMSHYLGDRVDVESAGVHPCYVHPGAIAVLAELGIDISNNRSKHVMEFEGEDFQLAVTLCGHAKDVCGVFPWAEEQVHMGFDDPITATGSNEDILNAFRKTRDEIKGKLLPFIEERCDAWIAKKEKER
jgi:arsenate reductase